MASRSIIRSGIVRGLQSTVWPALSKKLTCNSIAHVPISSQTRTLAYAQVHHAEEYREAMEGRHGRQLQLAYEEGKKYEDEAFDPFEAYKIDNEQDFESVESNDYESDEGEEKDDDDDIEYDSLSSFYNPDGSLRRTKAELVSLKSGAPAGGKFAIINLNGSQQKVTKDDVIILNKLRPVEKWSVGSTHTLNADNGQVMLMGSQELTLVGMPYVNGGEVDVMVEEITRDKKVIVFKKKRRKNYRKKNGHKREVTFLRVLDIRFPNDS
mmetsp:Transcript_2842/g.5324  ORF Transcript_2842/g.5324 Transcript_2842/m.5324 type:complete len:267 (+) Transcript_2842:138-938(+)|eukprot:CAMPEP_0176482080 /NCGR_PEP_ID=MMETSP0200_2-20121128/3179_1 /TAXON_ID=947934 /ORGANISM="Chaetoceros sp., Strain GSL56" /LENGTH=266 /DNA_ID=CAMNT_0017878361 /DNA_START=302 /DNA_END=1102 /DNA_ORIENTATION=-